MRIINGWILNLLITDASCFYKNDSYLSNLRSGSHIEFVYANSQPVDLLSPMRLCLLMDFN
jgi:hypothetical protein